ncbi:Steroid sulfotransferase [Bertholletia excelsa]
MRTSELPSVPPKYLVEDNLTQECIDLLSSLPRDKGWVASHLYQYQGFWHHARQLQGVLTCQQHFEAQDSDILLVTTPKSGTTWLKALLYATVNRSNFPPDTNHPLLSQNPHHLVPFLELTLYVDRRVPDFTAFSPPRLFSTHLPFISLPESVKSTKTKIIYLCRDPKDTLVSLWHFTNKLRPAEKGANSLEDVLDRFCRGASICGPFWDHVLEYWKESLRNPDKVIFLKYEEIKENPEQHLMRLAEFLGCPFSLEGEASGVVQEILELCSFDKLSNLEVNKNGKLSSGEEHKAFFRRGEVGDWKNFLTADMVDRIDRITEEKLGPFGFRF